MIFAVGLLYPFSMTDLSHLDSSELYDLLALFTRVYTRMLSLIELPSKDFLFAKGIIEQIQSEIHSRQSNIIAEPVPIPVIIT